MFTQWQKMLLKKDFLMLTETEKLRKEYLGLYVPVTAARQHGLSYSELINQLKVKD